MNIFFQCHTLSFYYPPDSIHPLFSREQVQIYGNYTVFGQLLTDIWTVCGIHQKYGDIQFQESILDFTMIYPFFCCILALIFRYFIIKSIENMGRGVSNRSYKLQKEIVWVRIAFFITLTSLAGYLVFYAAKFAISRS